METPFVRTQPDSPWRMPDAGCHMLVRAASQSVSACARRCVILVMDCAQETHADAVAAVVAWWKYIKVRGGAKHIG
jgi:hypothetical protein